MRKFLLAALVINLLLLNSAIIYLFLRGDGKVQTLLPGSPEVTEKVTEVDTCGSECQSYIDTKLSELKVTPLLTPTAKPTTYSKPIATAKAKSVMYIPIPGSANTTNTEWTTLAGTDFYLSKSDYSGITGVYFEANMKLINGNGTAYLRLYDLTHSVAVNGSQINTSSQTSTFVTSGAISLWEGYNHYVVQAKSLTADTSVFESGRLKILTEN